MIKTLWFILVFILCFYFFNVLSRNTLPKVPNYYPPIMIEPDREELEKPINNSIIEELNANYSRVKNIYYPKIIIENGFLRTTSTLCYEKNNNFRMKTSSFFGLESDIGSNKDIFWFWSKRMNPSALFWSKHDDIAKTYLKTPFHPVWMMETIGINEIDPRNYEQVISKNGYLWIKQSKKDPISGKIVDKRVLIDENKKTVCSYDLIDNNTHINYKIVDYHKIQNLYFPKTIKINWVEEKISMTWHLDAPIINVNLNPDNWRLPNIKPVYELGDYIARVYRVSSR